MDNDVIINVFNVLLMNVRDQNVHGYRLLVLKRWLLWRDNMGVDGAVVRYLLLGSGCLKSGYCKRVRSHLF